MPLLRFILTKISQISENNLTFGKSLLIGHERVFALTHPADLFDPLRKVQLILISNSLPCLFSCAPLEWGTVGVSLQAPDLSTRGVCGCSSTHGYAPHSRGKKRKSLLQWHQMKTKQNKIFEISWLLLHMYMYDVSAMLCPLLDASFWPVKVGPSFSFHPGPTKENQW